MLTKLKILILIYIFIFLQTAWKLKCLKYLVLSMYHCFEFWTNCIVASKMKSCIKDFNIVFMFTDKNPVRMRAHLLPNLGQQYTTCLSFPLNCKQLCRGRIPALRRRTSLTSVHYWFKCCLTASLSTPGTVLYFIVFIKCQTCWLLGNLM